MNQLEVVEHIGEKQNFIWKYPKENFLFGTQLIVRETQEAIFFMNGQALDSFGPGRHTLVTENLPKIHKLFSASKKTPPFNQNCTLSISQSKWQ